MRLQLGHSHPITINLSWNDFVAASSLAALGAVVTRLFMG
jgi:hypothetical protein